MEEHLLKQILNEARKTSAILQLVYSDQIVSTLEEIRKDPVVKEILSLIGFGEEDSPILKERISKKLGCSPKTVERRLNELSAQGLLISRPHGKGFTYRSSGLL